MPLKKLSIPIIFISVVRLFSSICIGQPSTDAFNLARLYFRENNYSQSILEAKRTAFFDDSLRCPAYHLLSDIYVQLNMFDEAISFLELAENLEPHDSLKMVMKFQKINLFLRDKEPAYALIELSELNDIKSPYFVKKRNFYFIVAYFQIKDFRLSKEYADKILRTSLEYDSIYVNNLFRRAFKNSAKSHVWPEITSALVPGSGQLMAGYPNDAMKAFLLNTILGTVTFIAFKQLQALDAILTLYPIVRRYYLSNIFNARKLAVTKTERVNTELFNELLDYIDHLLNNDYREL